MSEAVVGDEAMRRTASPPTAIRPSGMVSPGMVLPATVQRRRRLQLVLAGLWLGDGLLQMQAFMFTPEFPRQMLAPTAQGNPGLLAGPILWAAGLIQADPVATNTVFALIQVLLGLGIAWRPALRPALVASIGWSLGVWWFGEGFGGVLAGTANPLSGAPGAVLLYALLAVLLWPPAAPPAAASAAAPVFVAARPVGAGAARAVWLLVWAGLAGLALLPATIAPDAAHDAIVSMAGGQPGWLAAIQDGAAVAVAGAGGVLGIVSAVVFAVVAVGILAPAPVVRGVLVLAVVVSALIWVVGEGLGGVFGGQATDLNSGPLLALLAAAYWPTHSARRRSGVTAAQAGTEAHR